VRAVVEEPWSQGNGTHRVAATRPAPERCTDIGDFYLLKPACGSTTRSARAQSHALTHVWSAGCFRRSLGRFYGVSTPKFNPVASQLILARGRVLRGCAVRDSALRAQDGTREQ